VVSPRFHALITRCRSYHFSAEEGIFPKAMLLFAKLASNCYVIVPESESFRWADLECGR
jgi:hypothetical protein